MYLFLMSHSEKIRKMGLDKWRAPLGVSEDLCLKEFKRKVIEAIRELVSFNVAWRKQGTLGHLAAL